MLQVSHVRKPIHIASSFTVKLFKTGGVLLLLLTSRTVLPQEGSITFSDTAPPPTEQEKKAAKELRIKAEAARDRLQTLASVLRALKKVQETVKATSERGIEGSSVTEERLDAWSTTGNAANSPDTFKTFIRDSLETIGYLQTLPAAKSSSPFDFSKTEKHLAALFSRYQTMFDEGVVEHGTMNQTFRYYPFVVLEKQPFVDCRFINDFSRDFRCDARKTSDRTFLNKWCRTSEVENFSHELYPEKQIWVLKGSAIKPQVVKAKCD